MWKNVQMSNQYTAPGLFLSHDKHSTNTISDKSVDGVLGIWTLGGMMVGADKSS